MKVKRISFLLCFISVLVVQLSTSDIKAGASSQISAKNPVISYTVQQGDTLSEIADMFDVSLSGLVEANNLKNSTIRPNEILIIPDKNQSSTLSRGNIIRDELMLLARAIHAEARGESFTGKVAVGAVILNRVSSPQFPDSIKEVILQRNKHTVQFTPVADGSINLAPDEEAVNAALEALKGTDPTGGALFFYNPSISSDQWIKTLPVVTRIGNHVFASTA
jgi:N-acetylmuramoyl-L-alanine amidase